MFLGVKSQVWTIMLVCVAIAALDVFIRDYLAHRKNPSSPLFNGYRWGALLLTIVIAVVATVISKNEKYVGAPMVALIIGIIIVNCIPDSKINKDFKKTTSFVGKHYLSFGIVMLGCTLSFTNLFSAVYALPLVVFNVLLSFGVANLIGRKVLHVSPNTCTLVGGGTCVCGGTAIAALSPIVKAKEEETAYALTAIFLFDLLACLTYPYLAIKIGLTDAQFGYLAGTAVNDTSSVIAAQETFAQLKGIQGYALPATIKVVRTTMIIVLALVFSLIGVKKDMKENNGNGEKVSIGRTMWKALPKFILYFILTVTLNTILTSTAAASTGFYKEVFKPFFNNGYKFFVTLALAGVGFKIKFKDLFTNGLKPIALGGCTWIALFISSLTYALLFV